MSTDPTLTLQRKVQENYNDGDIGIAGVWLAFYVIMVVGPLLADRIEIPVPPVLVAAVLGGCAVLGWRSKKKIAAQVA